jgi:hemoglobin
MTDSPLRLIDRFDNLQSGTCDAERGGRVHFIRYGQPRLRQAHLPFPIDQQARDAWMDCMQQALAEQVTDGALLAQLKASFFKTADFLRNQ